MTDHDPDLRRRQMLDWVKDYVDERLTGARIDFPLLLGHGFVLAASGGVSMVFMGPGDPWYLNLVGAVAIDVPDIPSALFWVNEKNRTSAVGAYYIVIGRDDRCAVVFDELVRGELLDPQLRPNMAWVVGLVRAFVEKAAVESEEFLREQPGRALSTSDQDLTSLTQIALPAWSMALQNVSNQNE